MKTPAEMIAAVTRNLPARTGKTVDEWIRIVQREGPPLPKDRIAWLREAHNLGSVTAKIITDQASGGRWARAYENADTLVEGLYSGARAALRPLYDAIARIAHKLGKDVTVSPRKTYTSLIRHRQFAVIKPTARARIDVGFALPGVKASGRLKSRSVGSDRMTHAIAVSSRREIDAELQKWLRKAYEKDG